MPCDDDVFIGPSCDDIVRQVGILSPSAHITYAAEEELLKDPDEVRQVHIRMARDLKVEGCGERYIVGVLAWYWSPREG